VNPPGRLEATQPAVERGSLTLRRPNTSHAARERVAEESAARDSLAAKLKQANQEASALEKVVKSMLDPPKSLLDALSELQAKAEGLKQAKQAAKAQTKSSTSCRKNSTRKGSRPRQARCGWRKQEPTWNTSRFRHQKAAKAIAVEKELRTRFRGEIQELFSLLGEPSDSC
jgi:hypothetical protein